MGERQKEGSRKEKQRSEHKNMTRTPTTYCRCPEEGIDHKKKKADGRAVVLIVRFSFWVPQDI